MNKHVFFCVGRMYRSLLQKDGASRSEFVELEWTDAGLFENLYAESRKCDDGCVGLKNVYKISKKTTLLNLKMVYEYLTISVSNVSHALIMKYIWLEYKKWADSKTEDLNNQRLSKIKDDKRNNTKKSKTFKGTGGSDCVEDIMNIPIDSAFLEYIQRLFSNEFENSKHIWETIYESFDTHVSSLDIETICSSVYYDGLHFKETIDTIPNQKVVGLCGSTDVTSSDHIETDYDGGNDNDDDDDEMAVFARFVKQWERGDNVNVESCSRKRKATDDVVDNLQQSKKVKSEESESESNDRVTVDFNILKTTLNIYDTFKKEMPLMDLKNMVHTLKMELVSMDLETGRINTNTLSGDERFEAMLFCLDLFEWVRGDSQVEMHEEMMLVMLPLIYGDEWVTNHEHILVKHNVLKYYPDLVMICARRWGKTTGTAMMVSTGALFIPSLKCIIFATGQRVSFLFMDEIVKMMNQSPFMASCEIVVSNNESLIIKHFGNLRELRAMPANLEVCFCLFVLFCFVCLRDTVCTHVGPIMWELFFYNPYVGMFIFYLFINNENVRRRYCGLQKHVARYWW